jgi:hypothetical protein
MVLIAQIFPLLSQARSCFEKFSDSTKRLRRTGGIFSIAWLNLRHDIIR